MQIDTPRGPKHVCCALWSWGGKPLVNKQTHIARIVAHDALDPLWKEGRLTRTEAYRMLAKEMEIPRDRCHIGDMNLDQLQKVPYTVQRIKFKLNHVIPNYPGQQEAHRKN